VGGGPQGREVGGREAYRGAAATTGRRRARVVVGYAERQFQMGTVVLPARPDTADIPRLYRVTSAVALRIGS
jgi:hypothetical protein